MALIRFAPARGFEGVYRRMNKLMNEMQKDYSSEKVDFAPHVDIYEDDKNIYFHSELPGVAKEDVKIGVNEDRMLSIKGEKKSSQFKQGTSYLRSERKFGEFSRSFILPDNVDYNSISAKFDSGVLNISIPKKEPEKPKEYEISIG
jgi:HSP20 family protein